MQKVSRGDLFYADLSPVIGSEQGGIRPVLILQNDIGNKYSPTTIIAAISSKLNKNSLPTHVLVSGRQDLPQNSVILTEQIRTIDKKRLQNKIGCLDKRAMDRVDRALTISLALDREEEF